MIQRLGADSGPGACSRGASLVEVLVALSVFAINLLAWHAALQLVFAMLRHMGMIEAQAAEDIAFVGLCVSAAIPPRLAPRRGVFDAAGVVRHVGVRRAGLTLIEVLIAVAISMILLGLVAASVAMARRSTAVSLAVAEAVTVRLVLPALLHDVIGVAGRGLGDGAENACGVSVKDDGRRLELRFVEQSVHVEEHIFAARDGAGRPALYLRRLPHPRQPWIEDVTGFSVVEVDHNDATWVRAVHLVVEHASLDAPLRVAVPLLHHPCVARSVP